MDATPRYVESPVAADIAVCCDFTTCCYSALCALLCLSGVAVTFIFSAIPSRPASMSAVHTQQTWLLGPVLILLGALVAVKTMMHVRKQRLRGGRRRRRQRRRSSLSVEPGVEVDIPPRPPDLPPTYEEVLKLMQEERRPPAPAEPMPPDADRTGPSPEGAPQA